MLVLMRATIVEGSKGMIMHRKFSHTARATHLLMGAAIAALTASDTYGKTIIVIDK